MTQMTALPQADTAGNVPAVILCLASGSPLWLCWTDNCRGRSDYGLYVLHAVTDTGKRTLCGCKIQEVGDQITADNRPSCKRCQRILVNIRSQPHAEDNA